MISKVTNSNSLYDYYNEMLKAKEQKEQSSEETQVRIKKQQESNRENSQLTDTELKSLLKNWDMRGVSYIDYLI